MHAHRAKANESKATHGLVLGPILGIVFLFLSMLRVLGDAGSAAFLSEARIAPLEPSIWGMLLAWRLAGFAGSLVLVHVALGVLAWALAWLSYRAWPTGRNSQRVWTCLWLVLAVTWILAANAAWFPSSSLGKPYAQFVQSSVAGVSLFDLTSLAFGVASGATAAAFVWRNRRRLRFPRLTVAGPAAVVSVLGLAAGVGASNRPLADLTPSTAEQMQPNVILIGLDSVRGGVGQEAHSQTPVLRAFLGEATVFEDTTTPLARTFGAWVSILTGRHPHTTGANINLLPRDLIQTGRTLPEVLSDIGYETIYGIDEVRFSNVDESYGFDRIIGPRIGSADFMIEFFGDTPLSNLLVNTRLGDWLFPELHGNRAAEVLYDPDTFISDLERGLYFDSPTFLAVHLTLPHWPYTFAASEPRMTETMEPSAYPALYAAALERVDRQFADLMAMLDGKGALDHAIVVLLSDHGESLGERSPLSDESGSVSPALGAPSVYGHGTHVFSNDQYKVLLAFKGFGDTPMPLDSGRRVSVPATLEDIAPTILDMLGHVSRDAFDGRSLAAFLTDKTNGLRAGSEPRIRFLETEFNPPGVSIEQAMTASAIESASSFYRIDAETDRVEIRPDLRDDVLESRQYAAVLGEHWMASVPASGAGLQHLVYVGPHDGLIWLDAPPSSADAPVLRQLWAALRDRFVPVATRTIVADPGFSE